LVNYRAFNYAAAGLKLVWKLSRRVDLRAESYLFQPYEQILRAGDNTAYFSEPFDKRYWIFNSALVYHTFFGPISASLNYFENPEEKFYAAINIGFLIFNRRAIKD
jgi:NTE family protein